MILGFRMVVQVFLDSLAFDFLNLLDGSKVNTVLIVNIAVGIGHSHNLSTECGCLLVCIDSHVARTGDNDGLALEGIALVVQHLFGEVAETVAGRFGTCKAAAVGNALAGENAGEFVA